MFQFFEKLEVFILPSVTSLKCRVCLTDINLDFLTRVSVFSVSLFSPSVYYVFALHVCKLLQMLCRTRWRINK